MTTLTTCDLSTQPDLNPTDFQVYVLELVRNAKVPNLAMLVTDQSAGSTIINALTNQAKQSHIDWYQLSSRLCRTYRLPVGTMITTDVLFVEGLEQYLMQYPLFTLDLLFRRAKQMMATIVTIDEQSFAEMRNRQISLAFLPAKLFGKEDWRTRRSASLAQLLGWLGLWQSTGVRLWQDMQLKSAAWRSDNWEAKRMYATLGIFPCSELPDASRSTSWQIVWQGLR
jgi:hypothetical protein